MPAERWATNEEFLVGVDLYNHGYLWEAHEAWENLWHPAKGDELQAEFLQGLIQCTAAALKVRMDQPRGLERLAALGTARLEKVARSRSSGFPPGMFMGVDLVAFVADFRAFAASSPEDAESRPRLELDA